MADNLSVNDLLSRPLEESPYLDYLAGFYYNHIPEYSKEWSPRPTCEGVTIKWVRKHDSGRRIWILGFLCWQGEPCMVFQNGGREGDDDHARWVFDEVGYVNAVRALTGCSKVRVPELIQKHWKVAELGNFYGRHLDSTDPPWDEVDFDHG